MGMQGGQQACPPTAQNQDIRVDHFNRWLRHGGELTLSCRCATMVDDSMLQT
jgi:hypothetical protein